MWWEGPPKVLGMMSFLPSRIARYSEVDDYALGPVGNPCVEEKCSHKPVCMVGHFTQIMWKDTYEVGCGKAKCGETKDEKGVFAVSCRYRPVSEELSEEQGLSLTLCTSPGLPNGGPRCVGTRAHGA